MVCTEIITLCTGIDDTDLKMIKVNGSYLMIPIVYRLINGDRICLKITK